MPRLEQYTSRLPAIYWARWNKRGLEQLLPVKSWVDAGKLRKLAEDLEYRDVKRLGRVCERLEKGADIGCQGRGRLATRVKNNPSAYEFGERVAHSLQQWVEEGIAAGPLREEEIPWPDFTVSPLTVRLKPNGSARLIVNMSAPHNESGPGSVNSGIDGSQFEAKMSSTTKFVKALSKVGVGALICKSDWSSAYKHQAVREEDLKLQVVEFGGRYFVELMLVFGAISSPSIFDDMAKVVLGLAILMARHPASLVEQHLDDVVAVGSPNDGGIWRFDKAYRDVSSTVGVRLAERTDPDKSFAPRTDGLVLGVWYDTVDWTWKIREDKLSRICDKLQKVIEGTEDITVEHMLSLAGKLVDIRLLVKGGKYNLGLILGQANSQMDRNQVVIIPDSTREQCYWWMVNLQAAAHRSTIMGVLGGQSPVAGEGWTDAAGGSYHKVGHGLGGVMGQNWFYLPWPKWINMNQCNSKGVKFSRKLTCLEMLGPLVLVSTFPDVIRNTQVVVYVDNQGACDIYRKGYSTSCLYSYTVAKALWEVSQALNCTVLVKKIRRCSDKGSLAADALSKASFTTFYNLVPRRKVEPGRVPRSVLRWLEDPRDDLKLGESLLRELASTTMILEQSK